MLEKDIIKMQLEEIKQNSIFFGKYVIEIVHFDGRPIQRKLFDNKKDFLIKLTNDKKAYKQYASVTGKIEFTIY